MRLRKTVAQWDERRTFWNLQWVIVPERKVFSIPSCHRQSQWIKLVNWACSPSISQDATTTRPSPQVPGGNSNIDSHRRWDRCYCYSPDWLMLTREPWLFSLRSQSFLSSPKCYCYDMSTDRYFSVIIYLRKTFMAALFQCHRRSKWERKTWLGEWLLPPSSNKSWYRASGNVLHCVLSIAFSI